MLVQTTQEIRDYEGNPIIQFDNSMGIPTPVVDENGNEKALTFRDAVGNALNAPPSQGEPQTPQDKADCFRITCILYADATAELSHKDCVFIEEKVDKIMSALVTGRIKEMLSDTRELTSVDNSNGNERSEKKAKHA